MKINGPKPTVDPIAPERTDRTEKAGITRHPAPAASQGAGVSGPDTVQLSSQSQLADRIRQAVSAGEPDQVRTDRVEQLRQKLAAGQVGNDPMALADRLIEHVLEEG